MIELKQLDEIQPLLLENYTNIEFIIEDFEKFKIVFGAEYVFIKILDEEKIFRCSSKYIVYTSKQLDDIIKNENCYIKTKIMVVKNKTGARKYVYEYAIKINKETLEEVN